MQSAQSTFTKVDALFTGNTGTAYGTNELRATENGNTLTPQVQFGRKVAPEFSSQKKTVTALNSYRSTAKTNTTHGSKCPGDCTGGSPRIDSSMSSTLDRFCSSSDESNLLQTGKRLDTCPKPMSISDDKAKVSHNYRIISQKENIENSAIYDDTRCRSNSFETSDLHRIKDQLHPKTGHQNDKDQNVLNYSSNIFTTARKLSIHSPQNIFSTGSKHERMPIGNSWGTFDFSHGTGGSDSWGGENSRCGFGGITPFGGIIPFGGITPFADFIPLSGLKDSNKSSNINENEKKSLKNDFCIMEITETNCVTNSCGMKTVKKRNSHRSDTEKKRKKHREKQENSVKDKIGSNKKIDNLEKKRGRSDDNVEGRDYAYETENNIENNENSFQSTQLLKENDQNNIFIGEFHGLNSNFKNIMTDDNIDVKKTCNENENDITKKKYGENNKIITTENRTNPNCPRDVEFDNKSYYKKDFIRNKNTTFAPRKSLQRNLKSILEDDSPIHYNEISFSDSQRRILKGFSGANRKRGTFNSRTYVLITAAKSSIL